ncbi:MAG TPA: hypothetical protein VIE91_04700 [Methylophilaceae bacterium]|jgi:uncharacterized protein YoaH (UPF0181 family)
MNTKILVSAISLTILSWLPQASFADDDTHTPRVNAREHIQHKRIAEGVRSGELTKSEATSLRSEQKSIRTEKQADKADGVVTKAERKGLHQDLNQASRDIHADKHNTETR